MWRFICSEKCFARVKSARVMKSGGVSTSIHSRKQVGDKSATENPDGYCKGRSRYWKNIVSVVWRATINEIVDLGVMVLQKLLQQL
jgi:hypothetical protein